MFIRPVDIGGLLERRTLEFVPLGAAIVLLPRDTRKDMSAFLDPYAALAHAAPVLVNVPIAGGSPANHDGIIAQLDQRMLSLFRDNELVPAMPVWPRMTPTDSRRNRIEDAAMRALEYIKTGKGVESELRDACTVLLVYGANAGLVPDAEERCENLRIMRECVRKRQQRQ